MSCQEAAGDGVRGETAASSPTGLATKRGIAELCKFTGKYGGRSTRLGTAFTALRDDQPAGRGKENARQQAFGLHFEGCITGDFQP